jgi:putative peptidoglycan lipid II flippase
LAGAAKLIVIARFFGAGDQLDAFLIAFLLPSFAADVVAGSFTPSLVPMLVRVRAASGVGGEKRFAAEALAVGICFMLAGTATLALFWPWLLPFIGSSFSGPKLRVTTVLFYALLSWPPMSALIAVWRAVLNASHRFALTAIAPIASPIVTVWLLYAFGAGWGAKTLCAGAVGGIALEWLILAVAVSRLGFPIWPRLPEWRNPELWELVRQYLPLVASAVVASGCVIVDQAVAGRLGSGQVAVLAYGNKLAIVLVQVMAFSVATAVLPSFSGFAARCEWPELRRTVIVYSRAALLIAVPLTIVLIAASGPLVHMLFERGAFHRDAARIVTQAQRFSLLQLPFAVLLAVITRLASSIRANDLLVKTGVLALALNIILDLLFSRWMGVAGIALATSALQPISLILLVALLLRREPRLFLAEGT